MVLSLKLWQRNTRRSAFAFRQLSLAALLAGAGVFMVACSQGDETSEESAGAQAQQGGAGGQGGQGGAGGQGAGGSKQEPPEVGVIIAKPETVAMVTELPGRVEASRVAEVRARVAGIVQKRVFTEGSDVKSGQLLFQIDSAPYQASLQSAKAQLASAEAELINARSVVDRYRPLVKVNAISQLEFDRAEAAFRAAHAGVAAAQASVRSAEINLGYARVTAPIAGRVGRALVTEGALVGQGNATPMAIVQQVDPVYVNFTQSSTEVLELQKKMRSGQLEKVEGENAARVQLVLEDGSDYGETGKLLFTDLSVDATSGQVTLRAEVPNKDRSLLPGMYVRVRLEQAQMANAIAVPQQAVTRTESGNQLTVIDKQGERHKRDVQISTASGNRWLVTEGLEPGEMVMVDGFSRLQMMPASVRVRPVEIDEANYGPPSAEQPQEGGPEVVEAPQAAAPDPLAPGPVEQSQSQQTPENAGGSQEDERS